MKSYTGATLLINENGSWWLFRGISNPYTPWVDTSTGKAINEPINNGEPWQVPALGGMPGFTDARIAVDRILPKDMFKVKDIIVLEQEPAYSKGHDAFIYVGVESIKSSNHHVTETDEYKLFNPDELESLVSKTSDYDYNKPTLRFMTTINNDSLSESRSNG